MPKQAENLLAPDEDLRIGRELERKYLKALADRLSDYETGQISLEALRVAFYSVRDTVWGLVPSEDFFAVCQDFEDYIKKAE